MTNKRKNIRSENNGGHGMFVGQGASIDLDGYIAKNNVGDGLHFERLNSAVAVAIENIPEPDRSKARSLLAQAAPSFLAGLTLAGLKGTLANFGIILP